MTLLMTYDEAVQIYNDCFGHLSQFRDLKPSRRRSERIHGVWYLRNARGFLSYAGTGFLARVGTRCRKVF